MRANTRKINTKIRAILVESKRHVYEAGYGWKQAGREAKAVIDRHR